MGSSMQTSELAKWLGLAAVTIRQWSAGEWAQYLSPTAQGGEGRSRVFNDRDARIIAHIARLKASGQDRDSIHAALKSMQADEWRNLPPMPTAPPDFEPIQMIPTSTAETAIDQQRRGLMREITLLEERIEQLTDELSSERESKAALQAELTVSREQIGELRGKLGNIEKERPAARFWLTVLVAAVILAVVATAILLLAGRGI